MKNGYDISWTDHALEELRKTIEYLEENWTEEVLTNFVSELEDTLALITKNPELFPQSQIKKKVRRVIVAKHNTLYYRVQKSTIEIISIFSHRQSSKKRKL